MYQCIQNCINGPVNNSLSCGLRMNTNKCVVMRLCPNSSDIVFFQVLHHITLTAWILFLVILIWEWELQWIGV